MSIRPEIPNASLGTFKGVAQAIGDIRRDIRTLKTRINSIPDKSVDAAAKLKPGSVTGGPGGTIAVATVTGDDNLVTGTVKSVHIANFNVKTQHVAAGNIHGTHIGNGEISTNHIAANTIVANHIQANQINANHISAGSINANHINAHQISASHIVAGTLTANEIASRTITANNIQTRTLTANEIAAGAITANEIAAGTITADKITAGTITATQISAGSITATQIAAGTITATNIAAGTITATNIAAGTITAANIATGTITASNIATGTITATQISAGTITSTQIAANTITANNIAAQTITAANISAGAITAAQIQAGTITATEIHSATITAGNIAASTITGANIAAGSIVATNIATGTITATQLASGTITSTQLAAGSVTATQLNVSSISAVSSTVGTLTGGIFQTNTSGARVMMGSGMTTPTGVTAGIVGIDSINNVTFSINAANGNVTLKGALQQGSSGLGNIGGVTQNAVLQTIGNSVMDNPSATATAIGTEWTQSAVNVTIARDTTTFLTSPASVKVTTTANGLTTVYLGYNTGKNTLGWVTAASGQAFSVAAFLLTSTARTISISLQAYTNASAAIGGAQTSTITTLAGQWTRIATENYVCPATTAFVIASISEAASTAGAVLNVDDVVFVQQPSSQGSLIIANSITAAQIAAGTITGTQILANSITAGNLAAGSVTATSIAAGAINGKTITGAVFQANTNGNISNIIMDSAGVRSYDASGAMTIQLGTDGSLNVNGTGLVTAATVQNQAANPKVGFDSGGFYITDSSGTKLATIDQNNGIKLPGGTGGAFGVGRVSWHDINASGAEVASAYGYRQTSTQNLNRVQAESNTSGTAAAILGVLTDSSVHQNNMVFARAWDATGSFQSQSTIINGLNQSDFLRMASAPYAGLITFGNGYINFGSGATSGQGTVYHGLGKTPIAAVASSAGVLGFMAASTDSFNSSSFRIILSGNAGGGTSVAFSWIAIG